MGKGTFVEKIIHDKNKGGCGGHTLGVFKQADGSYNGWCFSCHKWERNPYSAMPDDYKPPKARHKTKEEIKEELDKVSKLPTKDLPDRCLNQRTLDYFGVKTGLSQEDGTSVAAHYYPYTKGGEIVGYNVRIVDGKKFFRIGETTVSELEPFGWKQAMRSNSPKLFITEGELDAMSLFKIVMMHNKYKEPTAVISLAGGSSSVSAMGQYVERIRDKFKEVVLVFDQDEAGQKATDTFCKLMPEAKIAKLPLKDANDMLKDGRDKECFNIVMFQAKNRLSGKMVSSEDLWDKAKTRPEFGKSWPWPSLTQMTRGIRSGETYYIGGGVKLGKSCLVNAIATHFIAEHGERVFLCKPEEAPEITARKLAGYAKGRIFDDPNIEFDEIAFDEGAEIIGDNAILYDSYQKTDWEDVKQAIRQAVVQQGCKLAIIDPITCFTVGVSAAERNEILIEIATEAASMAKELDFTLIIFCHLNKPDSGKPHERGGAVQSVQFAGSRGMMRAAHLMIGLEGNKDPDLTPEQRNCRDLVLLEDRNFGESGRVKLWYNKSTGRLAELSPEQADKLGDFMGEDNN